MLNYQHFIFFILYLCAFIFCRRNLLDKNIREADIPHENGIPKVSPQARSWFLRQTSCFFYYLPSHIHHLFWCSFNPRCYIWEGFWFSQTPFSFSSSSVTWLTHFFVVVDTQLLGSPLIIHLLPHSCLLSFLAIGSCCSSVLANVHHSRGRIWKANDEPGDEDEGSLWGCRWDCRASNLISPNSLFLCGGVSNSRQVQPCPSKKHDAWHKARIHKGAVDRKYGNDLCSLGFSGLGWDYSCYWERRGRWLCFHFWSLRHPGRTVSYFYLSLKISTIISFHDCNLLCVCLSGIIQNKSGIINILRILLNNLWITEIY